MDEPEFIQRPFKMSRELSQSDGLVVILTESADTSVRGGYRISPQGEGAQ